VATPQIELAAAHRGRLSLLVNLLGKPLGALCTEMEGKQSDFRVGDVKYHLGARAHARTRARARQGAALRRPCLGRCVR
jgi:2-oxoglutarate dehydrogenase complex dehydrogenase (E1) component-like enzyme